MRFRRNPFPILLIGVLTSALLMACGPTDGPEVMDSQAVDTGLAREKGGQELYGHFEPVEGWPQWFPDADHAAWTWGSSGGVYAESPDRIWLAQRGELPLPPGEEPGTPYGATDRGRSTGNTDGLNARCESTSSRGWERRWHHSIIVVNRAGETVDYWEQTEALFSALVDGIACGRGPHQIQISPYDAEKHVWIVDDQLHQIYKFTYDGELVMTLGEQGVPGRGPNNFSRPTDIAFLPDGTFFISDGYDGKRVAKFDPDGNFLMDWGSAPADPDNPGPGEFNNAHAIAISADRRVFVADRSHGRVQVFDENGTFLDMWPVKRPLDLFITADDHIWVSDLETSRILKYDLDGHYLYGWGYGGSAPGAFGCAHGMSVDQEGNFYVAECFNGRVQKFSPRPNANPAKLVGQPIRSAMN